MTTPSPAPTALAPTPGPPGVYDNGSDQPLIGQVVRLGHLNLHKESSDPAGTSGNPNYSLAGAPTASTPMPAAPPGVATLTTGADGWTNTVDLYSGTYYVREDGASTGFAVCTDTHTVTVTVGQTVTANCTEQMVPGHVSLKKTSANPSLTEGNGCYSLEGATYAVYSDAACTTQVGTLTTGADGSTNTIDVPAGTYYVRETQASKGYYLCTETHSVTVGVGQTAPSAALNGRPLTPFEWLLESTTVRRTTKAQTCRLAQPHSMTLSLRWTTTTRLTTTTTMRSSLPTRSQHAPGRQDKYQWHCSL